ncbi:MAG: glycosyltransferase family 4 protein [Candidatus Rokuibacteriota bacterium]
MRVAFDARKLHDFGIGTYIRGLLGEFAALGDPDELVAYVPPGGPAAPPAGRSIVYRTERARAYSLTELWRLALLARRDRADVYHAPHYVCPPLLSCPAVVTIHDLIHLRFPAQLRGALAPLYARVMLRLAVRRAARVVTVSDATRRDIETRLGAPPTRVRVIPNGVAAHFRPAADGAGLDPGLAALGVTQPYLLFVGNALPHKNLPRLCEAFAALPASLGRLVLAGVTPAVRPRVQATCEALGLEDRVLVLAPVPEWLLPPLYQGATLLAAPSLWEGFGLTALEAMACGTPVLAANRGGLAEVVGGAGMLVDPTNVDALREGLYNLATRESERAALRTAGLVRARAFSWRQAAQATIATYHEASRGGPRSRE